MLPHSPNISTLAIYFRKLFSPNGTSELSDAYKWLFWPKIFWNPLAIDHIADSPFIASISDMELSQLLMNRHVRELHEHYMTMSQAVVDVTNVINSLCKENAELRSEIQRLRVTEANGIGFIGDLPYV
jgi:hypothetical protein